MDFADAPILTTERLTLRPWRESDLAVYAEMVADAEVMRYFGATQTRAESDGHVANLQERFRTTGLSRWAVEATDALFVGYVGLSPITYDIPPAPTVDIGWRLHKAHWGKGYATEAARRALQFAFEEAGLDEVVSFAPAINRPSLAVMERIGMRHDASSDFDHPALAKWPELQRCALYRIGRREGSNT